MKYDMELEEAFPIATFTHDKILHRDYETGDMYLDMDMLLDFSPESYELFLQEPERSYNYLREMIIDIFCSRDKETKERDKKCIPKNCYNFKIKNLREQIDISRIRNINCGKIYKIKGLIKRITKPISRSMKITYKCNDCGTVIAIHQDTKKIVNVTTCSCGNKNQKRFHVVKKEQHDIQELGLEEFPEETAGKQPHQIRVYLENDLVEPEFSEKLQPGKRIEITGIIKHIPPFMTKSDMEENISEFMFNAISINHLEEDDDEVITSEDIEKIKEIANNNPLEKLSESLAPSIWGNDFIKKAIVLQLAKGVKKQRPDGTFTRGDIHILLSGDPGQAKTVLLKTTSLRSPNSRYISGTRSSGVGITASLKRDELLQTWAIEAGVMVLSHKSLVCIDEVDKMDKDQLSSLYEPLESQTVSINKAGISATLQSETSVLAGANPIQGKFDVRKPLSNQIDLPSPLLNRFDIIFILIDKVDEARDRESVKHLFKIYSGETITKEDILSIQFFKKYISYARKLSPKINPELVTRIEQIYLSIRKLSLNQEGVPINFRNIEGLMRMAEAHAKIRLSETVELEDVEIAERILMFALNKLAYDESGVFDMSRLVEKVPVTKRGRMETILGIISDLIKINGICLIDDIKKVALTKDIQSWELNNYLEQLKREGQIFEPQPCEIRIV